MNKLEFKHDIWETSDCKNKKMKDTKECGKLSSNETSFGYICISVVKRAEEKIQREYIILSLWRQLTRDFT